MASLVVLRVFRAVPRKGFESQLTQRLASSSPEVVRDQPGCLGWISCAADEEHSEQVFISIWSGKEPIQRRFGETWQSAHLPEGYDELIDWCSVEHLIVGDMEVFDRQALPILDRLGLDRGAR